MAIRAQVKNALNKFVEYYLKNYKKMMVLPIALVIIMGAVVLFYNSQHGEFVNEDISLTGGLSITVNTNVTIPVSTITNNISAAIGRQSVSVSVLHSQLSNQVTGYTITVGPQTNVTTLQNAVASIFKMTLTGQNSSITFISSTLAQSAIYDSLILLGVAFVLVAIVSLFYFRNTHQAFSNVISIIADVINVVGILDILGLSFSTASIAGILMLMGYSADRNIILATNILKRKEGSVKYRLFNTLKTSITMDAAAVLTFIVLLLGTNNTTIQAIATILIIGVIFDDFTVWILNGSIQLSGMGYKHEETGAKP